MIKKIIIEFDDESDRINIDYEGDVKVKEAIFMLSMADHLLKEDAFKMEGDDPQNPPLKGWKIK